MDPALPVFSKRRKAGRAGLPVPSATATFLIKVGVGSDKSTFNSPACYLMAV